MITYFKKRNRLKRFKQIRQEKMRRILNAKAYLDKWDDIPLRELFRPLCDDLKIIPDKAAKDLVLRIILMTSDEKEIEILSRMLP